MVQQLTCVLYAYDHEGNRNGFRMEMELYEAPQKTDNHA